MRTTRASTGRWIRSLVCCVSLLLALKTSHAQTLTLFGTNELIVDPVTVNNLTYSQSSADMTVSIGLSGTFGAIFTPAAFNWSAVGEFGLLMSVPEADPQATFNIIFYNSNLFDENPENYTIAKFNGSTTGVSSNTSILALTKDNGFVPPDGGSGGLNDFTDVAAIQFTWGSDPVPGGSTEATLGGLAIVPEPSTWALFVAGSALCGTLAWRRRSAKLRH